MHACTYVFVSFLFIFINTTHIPKHTRSLSVYIFCFIKFDDRIGVIVPLLFCSLIYFEFVDIATGIETIVIIDSFIFGGIVSRQKLLTCLTGFLVGV